MKDFFKNKTNLFLSIFLSIVLCAIGIFAYLYLLPDKNVYALDFNGYTDSEIIKWCSDNNISNKCILDYEYNNNIEKNVLIYQSLPEGEKIVETINFIFSNGKEIKVIEPLKDIDTLKKEDIDNWIKINELNNVEIVYKTDDSIEKDYVISIEPNVDLTTNSKIIVTISLGEKQESDEYISIKYAEYIGYTVEQFESKIKTLKLNSKYVSEYDDYSSNVDKGKIIWHGSGDYVENEVVRYSLSLGKDANKEEIEIKKGEYINLSIDEFTKKAEELGLKAVHNESWDDYSDSIEKGKVIFNGFGNYIKGENFRYGLSLGKKEDSEITYPIEIVYDQFYKWKESDLIDKITKLGLKPVHEPEWDSYSDITDKGLIIEHGHAPDYMKDEIFRYGLSLGKKQDNESKYIVITKGQFINLTEDELIKKIKDLKLNPKHTESFDDYSSSVEKGKVVSHGYAEDYIEGEDFRYGLSLGNQAGDDKITITANQFVSKTVDEFTSAIQSLSLNPVYNSVNDDYSSTIEKGNIIWHSSGSFAKGANVSYSKSLGVNPKVSVTSGHEGDSENSFISYINSLGLVPVKSSNSEYSSTYSEGLVISYTKGSFNKGDSITYVLSKGKEKKTLLGYGDICNIYEKSTFDDTKNSLEKYLSNSGFINYSIKGVSSRDFSLGKIVSITVNNQSLSNSSIKIYDTDSIVINVCNSVEN